MITSQALIDKTTVEPIRGFMPEDIYAGFFTESGRMALCSATEKDVYGVIVFDARKAAVIHSLYVAPAYRRDFIGTELLQGVIGICKNLDCDGITVSLYDMDDAVILSSMLIKEGFFHVSYQTLYRFPLDSLGSNPIFAKIPSSEYVTALSAANKKMKAHFSNELIKNKQYYHFMDEGFDPEMSALYIKNNRILGCVLVSEDEDDGSISIEYANTTSCNNKMALMLLLKHTFNTFFQRYEDDNVSAPTYGTILATNQVMDALVNKLLPDLETEDHINTYAMVL